VDYDREWLLLTYSSGEANLRGWKYIWVSSPSVRVSFASMVSLPPQFGYTKLRRSIFKYFFGVPSGTARTVKRGSRRPNVSERNFLDALS